MDESFHVLPPSCVAGRDAFVGNAAWPDVFDTPYGVSSPELRGQQRLPLYFRSLISCGFFSRCIYILLLLLMLTFSAEDEKKKVTRGFFNLSAVLLVPYLPPSVYMWLVLVYLFTYLSGRVLTSITMAHA